MAERGERLAFIVNSASYERVAFALGVAVVAAASGKDVRVLFGYGGVERLKRDTIDRISDETNDSITQQIRLGLKKGRVQPISETLNALKQLGGKIYACPSAMELHDIVADELVEAVDEVRSVVRFVTEDASDASIIYV